MKILKKIIGWFLVLMCISGLLNSIVAIVTIFTSVGEDVYLAQMQLPTYLFLTVGLGCIAFDLLSKKTFPRDGEEIPVGKVKTGYEALIYICEAFIAIIGACLVGLIAGTITHSDIIMEWAKWGGFLGIIYFLPSPEKVFNYLKRRKHQ